MADVFISYKKEDRAHAERLATALKKHEISVWWDDGLHVGDDFRATIERELKKSLAAIVIWSPLSVASRFVRDEANVAMSQDKLLPVAFMRDAPIPLGFGDIQVLNLSEWNGKHDAVEMVEIVRRLDAIRQGKFSSLVRALGQRQGRTGGGPKVADVAHAGIGSLPVWRFLAGSLLLAALLAGCLVVRGVVAEEEIDPVALAVSAGLFLVAAMTIRAMHQGAMAMSGRRSAQFFDAPFLFWGCVSALLAAAVRAALLKHDEPMAATLLAEWPGLFLIVLASVVGVRFLAVGVGVLFRRVR